MNAPLHGLAERVRAFEPAERFGRVSLISSAWLEADGPEAPVGSLCAVQRDRGEIPATVVSIDHRRVVLAPLERVAGLRLGARVRLVGSAIRPVVGDGFLGRAVDALGRPMDGKGAVSGTPAEEALAPALDRVTPSRQLITGLRAIDGVTPLAEGQRIGVFAAPGVGKTTLLGRLAAQVRADCCVLCLVGERGREVESLWSGLAPEARARTVMVAATSDETAAMRAQAVEQALALAGAWRAQGRHVLLLLDSATRYAMALREIGLAAGEPPTVRAYTPGVFSALPRLVERCGARRQGGAVTAIMTVLSETDDVDDPITEAMKSLLDGHLVLSRRIAEQGRYPAIDISRSLSRLADRVMKPAHRDLAARALASVGAYEASRIMIEAGVYAAGSNPETDAAIRRRPSLEAFLAQGEEAAPSLEQTLSALQRALEDAL